MALIGLGMGATFSTIYDIAIGDIDPAEAGSASGSLSSVQQLANSIGAAVITTIDAPLSGALGVKVNPFSQ